MRPSLALGWASFAFLALGASPAHYWLDAGEIAAAGADLGVMHPPGAPGLVLLLHAATLIPVGSLGFRMSLLSALLASLALLALVAVLRRRGVSWPVVAGAVAWALAGLTFVRHGRVVEVYALGAALTMSAVWGFDPAVRPEARTSRRLLGTAAAVIGAWGFGDLRLVLGPVVLVAWAVALRRRRPWARWAPLVVALCSLVVLTLPLASSRGPVADWGDPETWSRLWGHVMADSIRAAYADQMLPASLPAIGLSFGAAMDQLVEDLGPFGPVLAAAGLLTWTQRRGDRGMLALLALLVLGELAFMVLINPMGVRDRQTGASLGLLAALVVAISVHAWSLRIPRARWAVLPLAATALVLPPVLISVEDHAVTRSWMPHAWARDALAQLPPGAILLTQSDDLSAGVLAARVLEGARPDVVTAPAQHLHKGGPDRPSARERQLWHAAGTSGPGGSERGRIVDVLTHPPSPPASFALELPGAGVFSAVPFAPAHGRPPLGLSGGAGADDQQAAQAITDALELWSARVESPEDAERLARTIDLVLRAWIGRRSSDPAVLGFAEASYRRLLEELAPEDPSVMLSLAAVHDATGRTSTAIALSRRALELDPGRNAALLTLALFLSRDPRTTDEALAHAERAVALRPHRAENWRRLAQVAHTAGNEDRAREARARLEDLRAREPSDG